MKEYNSVLVQYNCHECSKFYDFTDGLDMSGMRSQKCKDFDSSFIKNIEEREIKYNINFKCNKCKNSGKLQFIFQKSSMNDMNNDDSKTYTCQCGAKATVGIILLIDQKEGQQSNDNDIKTEIEINNINPNNNNFNKNMNPINNYNFNNYNNFMMNNMNFMNNNMNFMNNNINFMNNNKNNMISSMNNTNSIMNLNNMYRMNNMNNNNNINSMKNINIKNINNQFNKMNNLNNMMNNKSSIRLIFVFFNEKIQKIVPFNKKLKDVLEEIKIEKPELVKFINNIRNDILLCDGGFIDTKQTPEEINKEEEILHDGSELIYQHIQTLFNNDNMNNRSINLTFIFFAQKIQKNVPFNKKLKDVLEEIKIEKPELVKFINNIRNDILLCDGGFIDTNQTPEQINKEEEILHDGSKLVYQHVQTLFKEQ